MPTIFALCKISRVSQPATIPPLSYVNFDKLWGAAKGVLADTVGTWKPLTDPVTSNSKVSNGIGIK